MVLKKLSGMWDRYNDPVTDQRMQLRKRVKYNGDVARDSLGQWVIEDAS